MEILLEAYKRHKNWCEIVESFGCNKDTAEDIVQEMYIRLHKYVEKGNDVTYNNTVNYFYVYKILRSMFVDLKRKEGRVSFMDVDLIHDHQMNKIDGFMITENTFYTNGGYYQELYDKVMSILNGLYWYDRKVFELLDGEMSISELSRNTGISYYSLYNTYRKVKQILKDELL